MANAVPNIENIRSRISKARELTETKELLTHLFSLPDNRLLPMFGVTQWAPQEVHGLKDRIFFDLITELVRNGWNCNAASFGDGRRDTLLMEIAKRGFSRSITRLLELGSDADHNSQGYGASTPLMCTSDSEIMKKLFYYGANPLATNALGQTDFTYKILKGMMLSARFYLYNTEKIPFQSLLNNYKDCIESNTSYPYEPMYPLCLVPVVPPGSPYQNVIDKALINSMLRGHYLPFSSKALMYQLQDDLTVWQYVKISMKNHSVVSPALAIAYISCMAKMEQCRTPDDFGFIESYVEKPLPREITPREMLSKAVFVYLLFSIASFPPAQILRWLVLIGKLTHKFKAWQDVMGEVPFRVANSLLGQNKRNTYVLYEMAAMQSLLAMRVNISDGFGEFRIPDELAGLFAGETFTPSPGGAGLFEESPGEEPAENAENASMSFGFPVVSIPR
jgi:hypothetical protein